MRNRKTLFASLVIAMFLCTLPQAFAKVWYVKTTGNNANSGATEILAKASIQAMINSTDVIAGDTILVWGGTYTEQVVTGNLDVTIIGSQGGSRTIIQAPNWASMTSYAFPDILNWNGAGRLSSSNLKPIVFANASSSIIKTNIRGITVDGSTANMPEGATEVFAGLVYRQSQGLIGGTGDSTYVEVKNINQSGSNTNALNNTVGILFIERAKPTMRNARVFNFRNIGIGVIGNNTSALQTVQDHQPSPTIHNCVVEGEDGGTSSTSEDAIQAGVLVVNGARINISQSHIYGNRSGNAAGNRLAYGIYLWNARNSTIGHASTKSNGNVISDNELGLYVRVTVNSFAMTMYTIKNNNIVYNGGSAAGLGTASGKVANYASATAAHTTNGSVRFSHSSNFTQILNVADNAWGNSEAFDFYSYSAAGYTMASYQSSPVAYWRETTGDQITFSNPLAPANSAQINVSPSLSGSNASGSVVVDTDYGFTDFDQVNRAVYAVANNNGGAAASDPKINLNGNTVESGSVIITKPVKIMGTGTNCDEYPSVTLRSGLNEPTFWVYGMAAADGDVLNRAPLRDTVNKVRILANNTQTSGNSSSGPAVLVTGSSTGTNSPVKAVFSYMSISSEFDGSTGPQAYSTSQSGTSTLSKRYSVLAAGPYYALYTRRPENCNSIVGGSNVIDNSDNVTLPKFQFDNIIEVATCGDLNTAIANAVGPDFTTMMITANIGTLATPCEARVNTTEPVTVDVASGSTAFIHYLLNPGTTNGGGNNAVCSMLRTSPTSGGTHNAVRVTVYPPACLQAATNLVSPGLTNLVVAADGNSTGAASFSDANVNISTQFDYMGATRATAHNASPTTGNATLNGRFVLSSGADIQNVGGTLTSTNGTTFGDASKQVDLGFTSTTLTNFGGQAINMALNLIGTSGSRRLTLTSSNPTETPTINKRVFIEGNANRGSSVGTITLNGSGNCPVGGSDASSVLRNLNVATVNVTNLSDCIQTALGRVTDCDNSSQHLEGVGTSSADGSGGTVNLTPIAGQFNQNLEIAKTVTFNETGNATLGTGTLTLRRGADVSGSAGFFASTISMTQCFSAHTSGANPSMSQAITLAETGSSATITVAGYGSTNGVGTGNANRGVWQFSDILVNKDVNIRGAYHNVPSNLLATDCSLLSGTTFPGINPARDASNETVIGGNGTNTFTPSNSRIFYVRNSGADILGFTFNNVISNTGYAVVVQPNLSTLSDIEVSNNIVTSTNLAGNVTVGLLNSIGGSLTVSDLDVTGNYISSTSTGISSSTGLVISGLTNAAGQNSIVGNAVNVGGNMGVGFRLNNVNNTTGPNASTGALISNNWFTRGTSHGMLMEAGTQGLNGITIEKNTFSSVSVGTEINNNSIDPGANNITIRENIFGFTGGTLSSGVSITGNYTTVSTNRIFVNNNDLSGSTSGINISGTTSSAGTSANMFDLRFNWWGSNLGPAAGANVATSAMFAPTDSITTIGFVPFTPAAGTSAIADIANNGGRWSVYPVATAAADASASNCGWQYSSMMGPVLRVNGSELRGTYNTISNARDNASPIGTSSSTVENTDQIFVNATSSYGGTPFGYSATEASYPVVFNGATQPSAVRGLNLPTISIATGTGSISVGAAYPRSFRVEGLRHITSVTGAFTGINLGNAFANTVTDNVIRSTAATPGTFIGINSTSAATTGTHVLSDNLINLHASNSAPTEFSGVLLSSTTSGASANVNNNVISTAASGATRSVGIHVSTGANFSTLTVNANQIQRMAAALSDVTTRSSVWGTGIYVVGSGSTLNVNSNNVQGGNSGSSKGHDAITLDAPGSGTNTVNSNIISTSTIGINPTAITAVPTSTNRGYGIKIFSSTGSANIGSVTVNSNTIGSATTTAPEVASIYIGGTTGTIGTIGIGSGNTILNSVTTANAAIQIATSLYGETPASGTVNITGNSIGSVTSGQANAMFLAIGSNATGTTRTTQANNITTSVTGNDIRTSAQTVGGSSREVADARPIGGTSVRSIFNNNTFTHAAILTGEPNLADYTTNMSRTAPAVALGAVATTPVTIERLIATPLTVANSRDTSNTVEIRENRGFSVSTASLYYNENLTIPDRRILLLGPASTTNGFAELLSSGNGTGTLITSNGRENKDIRGGIRFNTGNTVGADWFGRISGGTAASNKGDVYLQLDAVGGDAAVTFRTHSPFGTTTAVTGLGNSTARSDIKGGFDDADDDSFTANNSTSRRTGVFRSGTSTSQFLKATPEGIAGSTPLNVYPNPASGDVTVAFTVPFEGMVRVALYNSLGQKVTDLREGTLSADSYTTTFSVAGLPSGTYHVRLVHDLYTLTTAVTVIK